MIDIYTWNFSDITVFIAFVNSDIINLIMENKILKIIKFKSLNCNFNSLFISSLETQNSTFEVLK
jgi:hypothetical protein